MRVQCSVCGVSSVSSVSSVSTLSLPLQYCRLISRTSWACWSCPALSPPVHPQIRLTLVPWLALTQYFVLAFRCLQVCVCVGDHPKQPYPNHLVSDDTSTSRPAHVFLSYVRQLRCLPFPSLLPFPVSLSLTFPPSPSHAPSLRSLVSTARTRALRFNRCTLFQRRLLSRLRTPARRH